MARVHRVGARGREARGAVRASNLRPAVQLFVCTNARGPDDALRSGCGASGPAVFSALKRAVLASGASARVWVTATGCQGHCPASGCAVTVYPRNEHLVEVVEADVTDVLRAALSPR